MKAVLVFLLSLAAVEAQQNQPSTAKGVIYGVVFTQDGRPAKGLMVSEWPLGVTVNGGRFRTKTNNAGEYRFDRLPSWGRYTVYGDDEEAGYSLISTRPAGDNRPEVEITPEHPEAELIFSLPPRASFVRIYLTNRKTGKAIPSMKLWLVPMAKPDSGLFTVSCDSDHVILVPPDKNLLLHIESDGFREWDESIGAGKPLNVPSGSRVTLDVQLDPSD